MALHEERHDQPLRRWHARLARERQNLSASVEAALTEPQGQEDQWREDDIRSQNESVIRPLLSLQSRPMPAVSPEPMGVTGEIPPYTHGRETQPIQQGTMLARLAHRISSLLPAVSLADPAEQPARSGPSYRPTLPVPVPSTRNTQPVSRRQTVSMPRVVLRPMEDKGEPAAPTREQLPGEHMPTVESTIRSTSAHLQVVHPPEAFDPARRGTGVFEAGQGEVMMANVLVTDSSMVFVTFNANPGPVLVQYISKHAGVGFTVHLTAPASMRASFQYLLF